MSNKLPLIGEPAPEFKAQTTKGLIHFPHDFKGKWVVFFSHPADFTPVCTTEFVAFAKRYQEFQALNTELVGLSVDHVYSHIKWVEWIKEKLGVEIPFPVVADTTGKIAELYGMIHPGASESATVRAVFIICPQGIIRTILYYPLNIGRNISEILRIIKAFQTAVKEGVAIPANWPENELIGSNVIVPPPSDIAGAQARLEEAKAGKVQCYDWWFCHRKL
ncbi:peroxiredoxin [Candidatus Bipolaricaulota bacterium]|nr:peroxiredoxin [Candidatus Bipolaricaulota bacterium]